MKKFLTFALLFIVAHLTLSLVLLQRAPLFVICGNPYIYSEPSINLKIAWFLRDVILHPVYLPFEQMGIVGAFPWSILDWSILILNSASWYAVVLLAYTLIRYRGEYMDTA